MRKKLFSALLGLVMGCYLATIGCDFTTGGDSPNTSGGAGSLNISGVYHGNLGGGLAVAATTLGNIVRIVITQAGNLLDVLDNQGSQYSGNVGSPAIVARANTTSFSRNQELAQAQVSWNGKDGVADKNVEFVGVIHLIAVEDIDATTEEITDGSERTRTDATIEPEFIIRTNLVEVPQVVTNVTITSEIVGTNTVVSTSIVVTTVNVLDTVITETRASEFDDTDVNVRTDDNIKTFRRSYAITEGNTQYRLEGTWIEEGGLVSQVDAIARGPNGLLAAEESGFDIGAFDAGLLFFDNSN